MNYKYPINRITFPPYGELRYWKDENKEYHVAYWLDDECMIKDDDKPLSDILRLLIQKIVKGEAEFSAISKILDISQEQVNLAENSIRYYETELKKVRRQRNYYSKVLKEKNRYIKLLEAELKHFRDVLRGGKNDY